VAPSRGGEQIDDVLDGLVGAVVGGFESAVRAILRVRTAVEAAVCTENLIRVDDVVESTKLAE
jgi:hypothetical protein